MLVLQLSSRKASLCVQKNEWLFKSQNCYSLIWAYNVMIDKHQLLYRTLIFNDFGYSFTYIAPYRYKEIVFIFSPSMKDDKIVVSFAD